MNILFYYLTGPAYGFGHKMRSKAVVEAAEELGHEVKIICNDFKDLDRHIWANVSKVYGEGTLEWALDNAFEAWPSEWLIVDLPTLPTYAVRSAKAHHAKVGYLNGGGHPEADLVWHQASPEQAIIRSEIRQAKPTSTSGWYVYGGGGDQLELARWFTKHVPEPATMIDSHRVATMLDASLPSQTLLFEPSRTQLVDAMASCEKALLHYGVSCWELAYLRKPQYVVSSSQAHLKAALRLERLGLARAWPKLGLPKDVEFLRQEFIPTGTPPDGLGAQRFIEELCH